MSCDETDCFVLGDKVDFAVGSIKGTDAVLASGGTLMLLFAFASTGRALGVDGDPGGDDWTSVPCSSIGNGPRPVEEKNERPCVLFVSDFDLSLAALSFRLFFLFSPPLVAPFEFSPVLLSTPLAGHVSRLKNIIAAANAKVAPRKARLPS